MRKRPQLTPRDHAISTAEHGREMAYAIIDAVRASSPSDADILMIYAHRLLQCNQEHNIWHGTDLHTETDDPAEPSFFDASGRLWACGQKLCPGCIQKSSQRHRKQARDILANQTVIHDDPTSRKGLLSGHHYKFLTLTIVNPGLTLLETRWLVNKAWSLFRKRRYFESIMLGGIKSEEFTVTSKGVNYHIHQLCRSRAIDWDSYRSDWTECVRFAFAEKGIPFDVATKDQMLFVWESKLTSLEAAVKEVAKYITKSDSWSEIPHDDLLDIIRIERWPRMFELYGCFRKLREAIPPVAVHEEDYLLEETDIHKEETILDTTAPSDLESLRESEIVSVDSWRKKVRLLGVSKYLDKLDSQILATRWVRIETLKRRFPYAELKRRPGIPSIDTDQIVESIAQIYERAGRPPPASLRRKLRHGEAEKRQRPEKGPWYDFNRRQPTSQAA